MDSPMQEETGANGRVRTSGRRSKSAGAFRTISEVAEELDVAQHVLRFWESKFPQVRPLKRGGGRRYYRPEDVDLLRRIRSLLYDEGYTIKGAQKLLKGQRRPAVERGDGSPPNGDQQSVDLSPDTHQNTIEAAGNVADQTQRAVLEPGTREALRTMRRELAELRDILKKMPR